jgi:hypothetical protein
MAMALGLIGGVVSAIGSLAQAGAVQASAEYNAKVAERNRRAVLAQTDNEIVDQQIKHRRVLGQIRAAYGENGFEMSGSPLDVVADTTLEQSFDIAKLKYQGRMKAEGYTEQATLSRMEGKAAGTAGYIGAATGLLGGFRSAYGAGQSLNMTG